MAEYVKLLNGRYITNALVSSAERRERKHIEFGLYGVNLLNKEVAKSSNLVVKLRILHHVLSPKQSLSGQEQFPLISAVFFYKIFEKNLRASFIGLLVLLLIALYARKSTSKPMRRHLLFALRLCLLATLISSLNQGTRGLAGMVFVMSGAYRSRADARVEL